MADFVFPKSKEQQQAEVDVWLRQCRDLVVQDLVDRGFDVDEWDINLELSRDGSVWATSRRREVVSARSQ